MNFLPMTSLSTSSEGLKFQEFIELCETRIILDDIISGRIQYKRKPKKLQLQDFGLNFQIFAICTNRVHVTSSTRYPTFEFSNSKIFEN